MKSKVYYVFLLLCFVSSLSLAQETNFQKGFKVGYAKGYCYVQKVGCIVGVIPMAPIPTVYESMNSYDDGYNRGFVLGKATAESKQPSDQGLTTYVSPQVTETPLYRPDFNFYQQMQARFESQDNNSRPEPQISAHDQAVINDHNDPYYIRLHKEYAARVRDFFATEKNLRLSVEDGWYHAVSIVDDQADTINVEVRNNRVIRIESFNEFKGMYDQAYDGDLFPEYKQQTEAIQIFKEPVYLSKGQGKFTYLVYDNGRYYDTKFTHDIFLFEFMSKYVTAQQKRRLVWQRYEVKAHFEKIPDGWNQCYATDNEAFCDARKVFVQNGKIIMYQAGDGSIFSVTSGGDITKNKSNVTYLNHSNGGPDKTIYLDIYFL